MRVLFTFSMFLISISLFGQFCNSSIGPIASDEPPGCFFCGIIYSGNTIDFSPDTTNYQTCFSTENSSWLRFYKNYGVYSLDISAHNCGNTKGIEVAILDNEFNEIMCFEVAPSETVPVLMDDFELHEEYHLVIDGIDGDECGYFVFANSEHFNPPRIIGTVNSTRSTPLCVGAEVCYSFTPSIPVLGYEWNFPASFELLDGGNEQDTFICVKLIEYVVENLSVTPILPCTGWSAFYTESISVPYSNKEVTRLDPIYVCPDDFPIEAYGDLFFDYGEYERRFETPQECDSFDLVRIIPDADVTKRFFQKICKYDSCVLFRDSCYQVLDDSGEIEVIKSGCDSIFILNYIKVERFVDETTLFLCDEESAPSDSCFLISNGCDSCYTYRIVRTPVTPTKIDKYICEGDENDCFQVADSCYSEAGFYKFSIPRQGQCDSILELKIVITSNIEIDWIFCVPRGRGLFVDWTELPLADSYTIFIDGDSINTVSESQYIVDTVPANSSFLVEIMPNGDCSFQTAEVNCKSIYSNVNSKFLDKAISVYPNPTTGNITIESDFQIDLIEVFNTSGQLLQRQKNQTFDILNEVSGVLFLKIWTTESVITKRILVI